MNLSDVLHRAAHRLEANKECRCYLLGFTASLRARALADRAPRDLPRSPDELDRWLRGLIAESEQEAA